MDRSFEELEAIVRNRICGVCTERTGEGKCGLEKPSGCALFQLFPRVAQAIQSVSSDDIQLYIDAIRRDVCSVCLEQELDGMCETRQHVNCALDAYVVLVVEAIEEATGKTFDKSRIPGVQNVIPAGPAFGPGPQIRL
jgi:hypothetical protein